MPSVLQRTGELFESWVTVSTWETMDEAEADLWYRRDRGEVVMNDF